MPKHSFKEAFLHYVWQYQYFNKHDLLTTSGEKLQVLSPGLANKNAGPDFYQSRLLIQDLEWHGTVEIHYKSSDWNKHLHIKDKAYNNVVLHLVWEQDVPSQRQDGTTIPTLELKNRVKPSLIEQYKTLLETTEAIPCAGNIHQVEEMYIKAMLERTLVERIETKANDVLNLLHKNKANWQETCYQWIGKCFGFKTNSEAFVQLCHHIPYSILRKYLTDGLQLEALLFGTAGFLEMEWDEPYYTTLKKQYHYLVQKHELKNKMDISEWKFMRMRPANFPTVRLAQFAAFLNKAENLLDFVLLEKNNLAQIKSKFDSQLNTFWSNHFQFGKKATKQRNPKMGVQSIENLTINAIVPLRFAHAMEHDEQEEKEASLELLSQLPAEKNQILSLYTSLNFSNQNAYESQSLIQLHNGYCKNKACLSCTIGHVILHPEPISVR